MKLYQKLALTVGAYKHCCEVGNDELTKQHKETIEELVKEHMPSGSGFDTGTVLNLDDSTDEELVFETNYHHMNDNGFYDVWTEHSVIVRPSLVHGFTLRITGRNKRGIKEYIHACFYPDLLKEIE